MKVNEIFSVAVVRFGCDACTDANIHTYIDAYIHLTIFA